MIFTTLDLIALAWFVIAWAGYAAHVEYMPKKKQSLNQLMNQYRLMWMERMLNREVRIVDTQVMAGERHGLLCLNLAARDRRRAHRPALTGRVARCARDAPVRYADEAARVGD